MFDGEDSTSLFCFATLTVITDHGNPAAASPASGSSCAIVRHQTEADCRRARYPAARIRLRKEIAIIIVDHPLDLALALSDTTVAPEHGRVVHQGPSQALRDNLDLRRKVLWR